MPSEVCRLPLAACKCLLYIACLSVAYCILHIAGCLLTSANAYANDRIVVVVVIAVVCVLLCVLSVIVWLLCVSWSLVLVMFVC